MRARLSDDACKLPKPTLKSRNQEKRNSQKRKSQREIQQYNSRAFHSERCGGVCGAAARTRGSADDNMLQASMADPDDDEEEDLISFDDVPLNRARWPLTAQPAPGPCGHALARRLWPRQAPRPP